MGPRSGHLLQLSAWLFLDAGTLAAHVESRLSPRPSRHTLNQHFLGQRPDWSPRPASLGSLELLEQASDDFYGHNRHDFASQARPRWKKDPKGKVEFR